MAQARRMADDFLQGKPDATPDEVAGCLGEPEELAQCFLEELDPELLERRKRRRKLGRRILAGVVAAAMILLLVWVVLLETQPMKVEVTERLIIYEGTDSSHTTSGSWSYQNERISESGNKAELTAKLTKLGAGTTYVDISLSCTPSGQIS